VLRRGFESLQGHCIHTSFAVHSEFPDNRTSSPLDQASSEADGASMYGCAAENCGAKPSIVHDRLAAADAATSTTGLGKC
jgi:hypothetical protein